MYKGALSEATGRFCPGCPGNVRADLSTPDTTSYCNHKYNIGLSGMSGIISIASRMRTRARQSFLLSGEVCRNGLGYSFFPGHPGQKKEIAVLIAVFVSGLGKSARTLPGHPGQKEAIC